MNIAFIDPLSRAWGRMTQALFKPFDITKWFVVGFTTFLADLTDWHHGSGGDSGGKGKADFDDVLDFPVAIFNWWDRGPNGPTLGEVLAHSPACVMGGIDQTLVARRTHAFLIRHAQEGIRSGDARRCFLANGCTIDSWVYPGALRAIVNAARH